MVTIFLKECTNTIISGSVLPVRTILSVLSGGNIGESIVTEITIHQSKS